MINEKDYAYLAVPQMIHREIINAALFRTEWIDFFTPIVCGLMNIEEENLTFTSAGFAMPASDYEQQPMFRCTRNMSDYLTRARVLCLPGGWELHQENVVEACTAYLFHMPIIAVMDSPIMKSSFRRDGSDVTNITLSVSNISLGIKEPLDEPSLFGMYTDKHDNACRLFIRDDFDLMEIVQMYERG